MSGDSSPILFRLRRLVANIYTKTLVICWVIALVPLAVLALLNYRSTRATMTEASFQALGAAAAQTAGTFKAFIDANQKLLRVEATRSDMVSYLFAPALRTNEQTQVRVARNLKTLLLNDPTYTLSVGLLDSNGSNILDTVESRMGLDESKRSYVQQALEYDRPCISQVEIDPMDGKPSLYFSCPVRQFRASRTSRRGVLRIRYSALVLQQLIVQHNGLGGRLSFACLLDDRGMVLADGIAPAQTPSSLLFTLVNPTPSSAISSQPISRYVHQPGLRAGYAAAKRGAANFTAEMSTRGLQSVVGAIAPVPEAGWHVIFVQPEDVFLAPVRRQGIHALWVAALVAACVAIVAIGIARLLILPILRLTSLARKVADGDLTARIPISSPDQIGMLADAFNRMTDSLERRQQELKTAHEQLQSIIDNASAVVYMKDVQGRYLLINRRHEIVFHTNRRQIIGKTDFDILPSEQARQLQMHDRKVIEMRQTQEWEETLLQDDGVRTYLSVKFPLCDAQGCPYAICCISTDITERKRAEQELQRERDFVSAILQTAGALVIVLDREGHILRFNRACEQLTGYTFEEVKGRPFWELLLTPEEREPVKTVFATLRAGQFPSQYENYWVTKHGTLRLIAWNNTVLLANDGSVVHIIGTGVDVTERAMAEEALRDSQTRLSRLISTAMDGIITVDDEQRIVLFNPAAETMFRCRALDAVGKSLERFIPSRFRAAHHQHMVRFGATGETRRRMGALGDITALRADGTEFPIEASISSMEASGNRFYTVIVRDVTERKRAEEDLRWYTTRLRTLHEIDQAILVARSPESIAESALTRIRELIPCHRSSVVRFDFNSREAEVLVAQTESGKKVANHTRMPFDELWFGDVEGLREGRIHVVADISILPRPSEPVRELLGDGVRSSVNVPLRPSGQLIGTLNLGAEKTAAFTAEHLDVAQEIADQLAVAIQQADLYDRIQRHATELEQRVAERTRELSERQSFIESELQLAREVQQVFMRQQHPTFPQGVSEEQSALRFFQRDHPTGAVGGDFYNIIAISDTEAGVFLADVMGHGMRAALVTAIVRGLFEQLKPLANNPGQFLSEINNGLVATLGQASSPMFVSAFHAAINITAGRMCYASAGHPSPMLARRSDGTVDKLPFPAGSVGPVLGLFKDTHYTTLEQTVQPGDLIVLFTDGLFEVAGPGSDQYGEERLLNAIRTRNDMGPSEMFAEIINEVQRFSQRKEFTDDVCLVGVEVVRLERD